MTTVRQGRSLCETTRRAVHACVLCAGRRSGAQWCARFGFLEAHHSGERVALRLPALLAGRGLDTLVAARHTLLHGNAARVYSLADRFAHHDSGLTAFVRSCAVRHNRLTVPPTAGSLPCSPR